MMANKGFICFDGYLKRTAKLSDQELGRLFRACMIYHATGEVTELAGRESVAFDFIREDIDTAAEAYSAKCETNRKNIAKRWDSTNEYDRIRTNTTEENRIPEDTNVCNKKEKEKENIYIDNNNARAIQEDHNRVLDAAEDAGFAMSNDVRATLIGLYADHGLQKVLDGLASCVKHGAPNLAYLEACLKGGPKKPKAGKPVPAQEYDQRNYAGAQDEARARMIAMMGGA
jgi:hypothetical protein